MKLILSSISQAKFNEQPSSVRLIFIQIDKFCTNISYEGTNNRRGS